MKEIKVVRDVLARNKNQAALNKEVFKQNNILCINIMGSPGAGKTTLIEHFIGTLGQRSKIGVIEGDYEGTNDTERLLKLDIPVVQINSRTCHLTPDFVHEAMVKLPLSDLDLVLIENVGNLICPASHELGETLKVVLLSVPEGSDKLDKYPKLFSISDVLIVTKIDLRPYLDDFSLDKVRTDLSALNHTAPVFTFSSREPGTINAFCEFIEDKLRAVSD